MLLFVLMMIKANKERLDQMFLFIDTINNKYCCVFRDSIYVNNWQKALEKYL